LGRHLHVLAACARGYAATVPAVW